MVQANGPEPEVEVFDDVRKEQLLNPECENRRVQVKQVTQVKY